MRNDKVEVDVPNDKAELEVRERQSRVGCAGMTKQSWMCGTTKLR